MKTAFLILSLLFIFFLFPRYDIQSSEQSEESFCGSFDNLTSMLTDYKEILIFNGISSDSQDDTRLHMLTVNVKTGTWTEFTLNEDGLVCIVQEGTNAVVHPILLTRTISI